MNELLERDAKGQRMSEIEKLIEELLSNMSQTVELHQERCKRLIEQVEAELDEATE